MKKPSVEEFASKFEKVTGMEFTEDNITYALVGIEKKQAKQLMESLGYKYNDNYIEAGYDGRSIPEHNYSSIQGELFKMQRQMNN
ncbi:hypothetical protein RZE82_07100 [Mollicutes bacterium LVI A0039]|nr:hypothetical protein RZE82_07100 [Mollicutes bacterium LVI A0039]